MVVCHIIAEMIIASANMVHFNLIGAVNIKRLQQDIVFQKNLLLRDN